MKTGLPPTISSSADPPSGHVGDQIGNRSGAVCWRARDGRDVADRRPDVPERLVHRARERVHGRVADASPATTTEVPRCAWRSAAIAGIHWLRASSGSAPPAAAETPRAPARRGRERMDVARFERQAMIRVRSGNRRNWLDDVEPVELVVGRAHAPPRRKVLRVAHRGRSETQEVRVERNDDVSLVESVERRLRLSAPLDRAVHWIPLMPLGLWQSREQRLNLIDKRG